MMSENKDSLPAPLALVTDDKHSKLTTPVSLTLPVDLKFEEWCDIGGTLGRARNSLQWLIGDWWRYGDQYGHDLAQQVDQWGLAFHTCQNYASVCSSFEISRRRENLSFRHHAEVAALAPQEADELLDWCVLGKNERRSTLELRREVKRRRREAQAREAEISNRVAMRSISPPRQPDPASVALDDSLAGRVVAPELDALTLDEALEAPEPPALDPAEIAAAALAALSFDAGLVVVAGWHENLTPEERGAARDVLHPPIRRPRA